MTDRISALVAVLVCLLPALFRAICILFCNVKENIRRILT